MMFHNKWLNIGFIITVIYCLFCCSTLNAQTSKKNKKKKEVSFIKKGWDDVTTRNNYYFNAKRIWVEMLKEQERNGIIDFQDTLPYYFHDRTPNLSANIAQLQQIIVKTGVVLQRHDYSRWKDDCYTLLGKAYFAKNEYDSALVNFQYVSTALRGKFNDNKVAISQKDILKAKQAKQKELDKLAKDKKKAMEQKEKEKKAATEKSIDDKQKRLEASAKEKEKELQRKIKAKEKMLKQKAKGKYKPPTQSASKTPATKAPKPKSNKEKKSAGKILDKISEGVTIDFEGKSGSESDLKKAENKVKALEYTKNKLEAANVEDSLTQKQLETLHKLTLWEKIKHLRSRPEALVWMTKSFIKQGNFSDAESIVEFSKTLVKLRKVQRKEIHLVQSYLFYNKGQIQFAAEALESALPFIKKKKEKNYYKYLLAQLTAEQNPQRSYEIYKELFKKGKDEGISFNALQTMYKLTETGKVFNEEMPELVTAFQKYSKSKIVGDQALYTLANISLKNQDTTKAIAQLKKAVGFSFGTPDQKAKSLTLLGDLAYEQSLYKDAYVMYDSAHVLMSKDTVLKAFLQVKSKVLKGIVEQQNLAFQQDSLIYLSTLSRDELAQYIKDQNRIERKTKRGKNMVVGEEGYSSSGMGNNSNFNTSQDQYTNKGQWYFYNIDMRTRGFNEFKQQWGERPYIHNWRRAEAIQQNTLGITELVKKEKDSIDVEPVKIQYKIPSTEEEFQKSYDILANSYYSRSNDFYQQLSNDKAGFLYLDSLINRFPDHELVPKALYAKMLMYTEMNQMKPAEKLADLLLEKYPDHELSEKIRQNRNIKYVKKDERKTGQAEVLYASLYGLYQEEHYTKVLEGKLDFINRYANEKQFMPKVLFLEALSLAQIGNLEKYQTSLQDIIKNYSGTNEAEQAKIYLNVLLKNNEPEKASAAAEGTSKELEKDQPKYIYEEGYHFVLIKLANKRQNSIAAVESINEEMEKAFPKKRIKASNSYLDSKNPLLLVKRFDNIADAKRGMELILKSSDANIKSALAGSEILLISQENFKELFSNKNYEEYKSFYEQNYHGKD